MSAMYTNRQLGINEGKKTKFMERLSSGYRINRAADDAAGLSISEKMRGQIRGLKRGSINTEEGIDMINTAEGAMGEQISILQRIRELTIQSYNDTNTQDDRLNIQDEVDSLLKEIDRISQDTEFNTIKVLQGDKVTTSTETIQPSTEYSEVTPTFTTHKQFPSWVKYDTKLTLDNKAVSATDEQDTSNYVIFNMNQAEDPDAPQTAYGPAEKQTSDDGWQGEWTGTLTDNYSAVVDFSAIASLKTKDSLYSYLNDLVGTGIGYECYTCDRTQGVCFSSDDVRAYALDSSADYPVVNLQDCITLVDNLADEEDFNNMDASEKAIYGNDYDTYVQNTADTIAKKIVSSVLDTAKYEQHFIRTTGDDADPYKVVFYDYRDDGVTAATNLTGDSVTTQVAMQVTSHIMVKNNPVTLEVTKVDGYWIQVAANSNQGVAIHFPDTSLNELGMKGYSVFPEGYCSATSDKTYNEALMVNAVQTGEHTYRGDVSENPGTVVETEVPYTRTVRVYEYSLETVPGRPAGTNKNGEYVPAVASTTKATVTGYHDETISGTRTIRTVVGGTSGTNQEFTAYPAAKNSLLRVDNAINSLTKARSYLGAMSNRLEHAYLNDNNTSENLQSAESRIRDADMADEMTEFSKNSILVQAAEAMLTQANQNGQGVLALLQ
jgi:flagellin